MLIYQEADNTWLQLCPVHSISYFKSRLLGAWQVYNFSSNRGFLKLLQMGSRIFLSITQGELYDNACFFISLSVKLSYRFSFNRIHINSNVRNTEMDILYKDFVIVIIIVSKGAP